MCQFEVSPDHTSDCGTVKKMRKNPPATTNVTTRRLFSRSCRFSNPGTEYKTFCKPRGTKSPCWYPRYLVCHFPVLLSAHPPPSSIKAALVQTVPCTHTSVADPATQAVERPATTGFVWLSTAFNGTFSTHTHTHTHRGYHSDRIHGSDVRERHARGSTPLRLLLHARRRQNAQSSGAARKLCEPSK